MGTLLTGGVSSQQAYGRPRRQHFKPPMTFYPAMEYSTVGTNRQLFNYIREEWTQIPIGIRQTDPFVGNWLFLTKPHIFDFGTFRLDAGYDTVFIVPENREARVDVTLMSATARVWCNVAVLPVEANQNTTPRECYLIYQYVIAPAESLVLPRLLLQSGAGIRVASSSQIAVTISGTIAELT